MFPRSLCRWAPILAFAVLCSPPAVRAQPVPTVSQDNPLHDTVVHVNANPPLEGNSESNRAHPSFSAIMPVPKGDTMTAMLSVEVPGVNGAAPTDEIIKNPDGTIPTWTLTATAPNVAAGIFVPGIVEKNGNNLAGIIPTDIYQSHTDPNLHSGFVQLAAFKPDPGMLPIDTFLLTHIGSQELNVPDFISLTAPNLYYGVDMAIWLAQSSGSFTLGNTYTIVNGTSPQFPGFTFSTTPLTDSGTGWSTTTPYSGPATADTFHGLSANVPEPSPLALAVVGVVAYVVGYGLYRTHRRRLCVKNA